MSLDTFIVSSVGDSLYEVKRYKTGELLESVTVDLTKVAKSDFETKRLSIARRYVSDGCPKGSAYWFTGTGEINQIELSELATRQHFKAAANIIRAVRDPGERQKMADFQARVFSKENPRFDHQKFHTAAGTLHSEPASKPGYQPQFPPGKLAK